MLVLFQHTRPPNHNQVEKSNLSYWILFFNTFRVMVIKKSLNIKFIFENESQYH